MRLEQRHPDGGRGALRVGARRPGEFLVAALGAVLPDQGIGGPGNRLAGGRAVGALV